MHSVIGKHGHYLRCAQLCKRVYTSKSNVLVYRQDGHTYITVKGTSQSNWSFNTPFIKNSVGVHAGFAQYADQCVNDCNVSKYVEQATDGVTFCGHSIGAAAAALMAYEFRRNATIKQIDLVMFGAPKIGNDAFASRFRKALIPTASFECIDDYVCNLPFGFLGYVKTPTDDDTLRFEASCIGLEAHKIDTYIDFVSIREKKSRIL